MQIAYHIFNICFFQLQCSKKMQQEKYKLSWNTYSDHLKEMMKEMLTSKYYADVTLISDDKKLLKAHRNILSACSPVLKDILQIDTQNIQAVIYLRGIQYSEIESILQFIYFGEASFDESKMDELLLVAKNLEIKELSTFVRPKLHQNESNQNEVQETSYQEQEFPGVFIECQEDKEKILAQNQLLFIDSSRSKCSECDKQYAGPEGLKYHVQSVHKGIRYNCNQCDDKMFTSKCQLKRHIEAIHENIRYACDQCAKQFTDEDNLKKHIENKHEGIKYPCNHCDYQAPVKKALGIHIRSVHEGVKHPCTLCEYKATTKPSLLRHLA